MSGPDQIHDPARWETARKLTAVTLVGRHTRLESLTARRHAGSLWDSFSESEFDPDQWTYLGYGPFTSPTELCDWISGIEGGVDPIFFACTTPDGTSALGWASLLRISPEHGVAELGHLAYSGFLKGTTASTEAFSLLAEYVFSQGYRRLEWKCDARNARSIRAARRLGFVEEGTFRQHMIVKHQNRDTVWFSILDKDWPANRAAVNAWLSPGNFDESGCQRLRLADIRHAD